MTWQFILGVLFVALFIGVSVVNARKSSKERQARQEDELEREQNKQITYNGRLAEFRESCLADWPHQFEMPLQRGIRFLLVSADRKRLRYVEATHAARNFINVEHEIEVDSIVAVELQQNSEVITSFENRTETKKQGALGRAAVGGVLLGGAGAIVGAATAGSKGTSTTTSTSTTRHGPVILLISTTDLAKPLIKLPMTGRSTGEEWLYRIRGCVAYLASNRDD